VHALPLWVEDGPLAGTLANVGQHLEALLSQHLQSCPRRPLVDTLCKGIAVGDAMEHMAMCPRCGDGCFQAAVVARHVTDLAATHETIALSLQLTEAQTGCADARAELAAARAELADAAAQIESARQENINMSEREGELVSVVRKACALCMLPGTEFGILAEALSDKLIELNYTQ
jgi:chorismate mutase